MMKTYRHIIGILFVWFALALFACSDDKFAGVPESGAEVVVSFRPTIEEALQTRAIGDASGINQITIIVFEKNGDAQAEKFRIEKDWNTVRSQGVDLPLITGHTYTILFWAQHSDEESEPAYTLGTDGVLTADYSPYADRGFSGMEELDAFYATDVVMVGTSGSQSRPIRLSRPLAQVNFADDAIAPTVNEHKAVVTFHNCPTRLNLLSGEITATDEITFTFGDFPAERLQSKGEEFYFVASNYLLAPQTGSRKVHTTIELQSTDGKVINHREFKDEEPNVIMLERNMKTNVLGAFVQKPESIWDGNYPVVSPLTIDEQNRYVIDEAADIAWLSVATNASTLESNRTFVMTVDVDMNNSNFAPICMPEGSKLDGNGHIIRNLKQTGGLLGEVTDLTVENLTIENINMITVATHVGTLVNTLRGNGNFSNIKISGASVSTQNGAAGGMVGYIVRKSEKERTENLNVVFDNCTLDNVSVSGTQGEGRFVGLLSGYDLNERVEFHGSCTTTATGTLDSYYIDANKSQWQSADFTRFDGWLGKEVYHRGTVIYGTERIIPKWDGNASVDPLMDGATTLLYSPFDLAGLQGSSNKTVIFKEDIDLDAKLFTPIKTMNSLDGENHTLYNLRVEMVHDGWAGAAFIQEGGGTFKNLIFDGANIKNTHDPQYGDGHALAGNAYAATLISTVTGTLTCENITCKNGQLYAVCKMGGLIGRSYFGKLNIKNCKVDNYHITNYKPGLTDDGGFVTHGEVGGLIGFILAFDNDIIGNCSVTNTQIEAYHYSGVGALLPGRHVNQFIGDIRTPQASCRVYLNNNTVSNNSYLKDSDTYSYRSGFSSKKCEFIGLAYYVWTSEKKGQVYLDGTKIFG